MNTIWTVVGISLSVMIIDTSCLFSKERNDAIKVLNDYRAKLANGSLPNSNKYYMTKVRNTYKHTYPKNLNTQQVWVNGVLCSCPSEKQTVFSGQKIYRTTAKQNFFDDMSSNKGNVVPKAHNGYKEPLANGISPNIDGMSSNERNAVLKAHNDYRAQLASGKSQNKDGKYLPKAKNMYKLKYSESLEKKAQDWANGCVFKHTPQNYSDLMGQNLYMTSEKQDVSEALKHASNLWWDELKKAGVNNNLIFTQTHRPNVNGHFTQMAWASTTEIGCGVTYCPQKPMTIVVCNYKTPGNFLDKLIYTKGNPCHTNTDCNTYPNSQCDSSVGLCEISN